MNAIRLLTKLVLVSVITLFVFLKFCYKKNDPYITYFNVLNSKSILNDSLPIIVRVSKNVIVENYFQFIDSLVEKYDSITPYKLTEHLLVRSNSWIIDRLQNTDYYRMMAQDSFVFNQRKMIVLQKGAFITIPEPIRVEKLLSVFKETVIDVNIPEFKLRIYKDSLKLYEFPIRVGRPEKKYLKMSNRIEDLRTKTGAGTIVNHVKTPRYINPVDNQEYYITKRDDNNVTKLPLIPFLETEINGLRHGQLIHPTTNPITLGKAYSNGCIGTKEADAWVIYYYAPINTRINIRYDLSIIDDSGKNIDLRDIYGYRL